jgi:hypothetical protein
MERGSIIHLLFDYVSQDVHEMFQLFDKLTMNLSSVSSVGHVSPLLTKCLDVVSIMHGMYAFFTS